MARTLIVLALIAAATGCSRKASTPAPKSVPAQAPEPDDAQPSDNADYGASLRIGGLDRLFIQKVAPNECVHVVFTGPGDPPAGFDIVTPGYFAFSDAWLSDCEHARVEAIGGEGTASWSTDDELCSVDIDITLHFEGKRDVHVQAERLDVENSSCRYAGA